MYEGYILHCVQDDILCHSEVQFVILRHEESRTPLKTKSLTAKLTKKRKHKVREVLILLPFVFFVKKLCALCGFIELVFRDAPIINNLFIDKFMPLESLNKSNTLF